MDCDLCSITCSYIYNNYANKTEFLIKYDENAGNNTEAITQLQINILSYPTHLFCKYDKITWNELQIFLSKGSGLEIYKYCACDNALKELDPKDYLLQLLIFSLAIIFLLVLIYWQSYVYICQIPNENTKSAPKNTETIDKSDKSNPKKSDIDDEKDVEIQNPMISPSTEFHGHLKSTNEKIQVAINKLKNSPRRDDFIEEV